MLTNPALFLGEDGTSISLILNTGIRSSEGRAACGFCVTVVPARESPTPQRRLTNITPGSKAANMQVLPCLDFLPQHCPVRACMRRKRRLAPGSAT